MHIPQLLTQGLLASALPAISNSTKIRTVVTTDLESDDLASLVRYVLYINDVETQGIIYTSSRFHWEGDGNGTKFFLPNREYNTSQTTWRPTGMPILTDHLLPAYAEVYPNLRRHDPTYPTPETLLSITKRGNADFEGEMAKDTDGSNLIKKLLLDDDNRPLYLQAWGGTNTIARALLSIEEQFSSSSQWSQMKEDISRKAVIHASGFEDKTYVDYIAPNWPALRLQTALQSLARTSCLGERQLEADMHRYGQCTAILSPQEQYNRTEHSRRSLAWRGGLFARLETTHSLTA